MNDIKLFNAISKISDNTIEKNSFDNGSLKRAVRSKSVIISVTLCSLLVLAIIASMVACISESRTYNKAKRFFDDNELSTEGLDRSDVKAVYFDIITNSFSNSKTAFVLHNSLYNNEHIMKESRSDFDENEIFKMWEKHKMQVDSYPSFYSKFSAIIKDNIFKDVAAFSDRLLKVETLSIDNGSREVTYRITMMDLSGNTLCNITKTVNVAYYVTALTATKDGGFLYVLGFRNLQYQDGTYARANGFASRVIKCDRNGFVEFDIGFDYYEGTALQYCIEKNGNYYFFGTHRNKEEWDNYGQTDVSVIVIGSDGKMCKSKFISGSNFDSLYFAVESKDGFILALQTQSDDGDFVGSGYSPTSIKWIFKVNENIDIIEKEKIDSFSGNVIKIGEKKGNPFYYIQGPKNDYCFINDFALFDSEYGWPNAYIDYGDYYLIVSEHYTGIIEKQPRQINSVWYYTETVYSFYDNDNNLIFRDSVDSTPKYYYEYLNNH